MNVVAVIPARSGSKRLPGKNIRPLSGKPLLAYSVEDGLQAELVNRVFVSTDCPEIAQIAQKAGAEVPILRPAEIAGDSVSDMPVMQHMATWLEVYENYTAEILVLLRPTTPFRADDLIDRCIRRLIETDADSVRSVRSVGHWHPYWMLTVDENGLARPFLKNKSVDRYYQRQLLPPLYKHDGYCDVIRRNNMPHPCPPDATLAGFYGQRRAVEFNDTGPLVNIDTLEDFVLAEMIFESKRQQKPPY